MMTEQEVINTIKEIIAKKLSKEPEDVQLESGFTRDLKGDSLDMIEISWEISEKCNIPAGELDNEFFKQDIANITIDNIVTIVCEKLGIKRKGTAAVINLVTIIMNKQHQTTFPPKALVKTK